MSRLRGFEVVKGYEDKGINLPVRKTAHSAGYDVEAAENITIPMFTPGCKPTLIPTGLKAYCQEDECYLLLNRSSGPKKGFLMANSVGLIDSDYYGNPDNDGEICFAFSSLNETGSFIKKGEKIGQGIIQKFIKAENDYSSNPTATRAGGFGSTGE